VFIKTITIRRINSSIFSKFKRFAKNEKKGVNQLVLDMLKQNIGVQKKKKYTIKYDDPDHLFGIWTDAEFDKIQGIIDAQRKMV